MIPIEQFSEEVFKNFEANNFSWIKELEKINYMDFLTYNLINYPEIYNKKLMFASLTYWRNFSLLDWKDVFITLTSKGSHSGLYSCITFLYKYVQIDSIKLYHEIIEIDSKVKIEINHYFKNRPGVLAFHELEKKELNSFNLDCLSFKEIQERLILEGAIKANKIKPTIIRLD